MKKKPIVASSLLLILFIFLVSFNVSNSNQNTPIPREPLIPETELSNSDDVWIITDLHYLSESLFDDGENFSFIKQTSAGKELDYPAERMEALIWQIEQAQPKLLLVSGDLTLNGEKQSALELNGYFDRIEKLGTQVYVIPGNHDISNGWARKFEGKNQVVTEQILPEDFQNIFAHQGYTEAFSTDDTSLSYAVQPFTNLTLLMLDSNVYSETEGSGAPPANGVLKAETLAWVETILQEAEGTTILPIMHHNLLEHNDFMNNGFVLDNAPELQALFAEYNVSMAFSGHTHVQDIASQKVADTTLYDVTTSAFSVMNPSIGKVTINDQEIHYQKELLNIDKWAQETNQADENLLHYFDYATQLFVEDGTTMGLRQMFEEQWYDESYGDAVANFVGENNRLFFSGENSQLTIDQTKQLKQTEAYLAIEEHSKGFLLKYTNNILDSIDQSDLSLSILLQ